MRQVRRLEFGQRVDVEHHQFAAPGLGQQFR